MCKMCYTCIQFISFKLSFTYIYEYTNQSLYLLQADEHQHIMVGCKVLSLELQFQIADYLVLPE